MTDEYLWPVRNIAEYAYCPRLFYLMEVEGLHLPSVDTVQGVAVHRRADRPSSADICSRDPERPDTVRSLSITNPEMRLTATIDLVEFCGGKACPIEYRKGSPKWSKEASTSRIGTRASAEPWPTDRVQVALQALLLRAEGYTVESAVIYYAEPKLRLTVPITEELTGEALDVFRNAVSCAAGPRPQPLSADPRCEKCSLQPVCLPDEIQFLNGVEQSSEQHAPRKLWPPHDDGLHIVAATNGVRIGIKGETLCFSDKDGKKVSEIPMAGVDSLSLLGPVQITTQAVHILSEKGVPIAFLSAAGRLVAMIDPLDAVSAEVRRAQVLRLESPQVRLDMAQALVASKVLNQRTMLMRNHPGALKSDLRSLARIAGQVAKTGALDQLRGLEGQAAAIYFKNLAEIIKGPCGAEFSITGRKRRPPPDPVNACLSLAYSMLTHECTAALRLARLEPSIGAYHVSRPGRPALALDLMEPFRPLIADSIAVQAFNRGELSEGHFMRTAAGCTFTEAGRKVFFQVYGRRMDTEITHPIFKYRLTYRRMLHLHARMIAAWLTGEIQTLSFLTTR